MENFVTTPIWLQVLLTAVATLLVMHLLSYVFDEISPAVYCCVTAVNVAGIILQRTMRNKKLQAWAMVCAIVIVAILSALGERYWF